MQLDEAVVGPVLAHRALHGGLHLEDQEVFGATEREKSPVELQVGRGVFIHRKAGLCGSGDLELARDELDTTRLDRRIRDDDASNAHGRSDGEVEGSSLEWA